MENLAVKIKISVLWIFIDFDFLLLFALNSLDPNGGLKQMVAGFSSQQLPGVLLGGAVLLFMPFVMAILSLSLNDASSRRANIILSLIFAIFQLIGLVYGLSMLAGSTAYLILIEGAGFVAAALIFRYAHLWPKGDLHA